MALLTDQQRWELWAEFMRGATGPLGAVTKTELRAAVDAIDAWVDANTTSFNTAIPQPARNQLTAKQKAMLLVYVVDKRHKVL